MFLHTFFVNDITAYCKLLQNHFTFAPLGRGCVYAHWFEALPKPVVLAGLSACWGNAMIVRSCHGTIQPRNGISHSNVKHRNVEATNKKEPTISNEFPSYHSLHCQYTTFTVTFALLSNMLPLLRECVYSKLEMRPYSSVEYLQVNNETLFNELSFL